MIQTQLLPLRPPYQIIAACGYVGLQVATLIVTEETRDETGSYGITTHSHPVVNYDCKQLALDDENPQTYSRNFDDYLSAEGAVWDKVEVRHIWVLGIEGAMKSISWDNFMYVVNKNDADWGVEITDRNTLWQFNLDMRRVWEGLRGLGVSVVPNKCDPVRVRLGALWTSDDDTEVDHFIMVELEETTLFTVLMGEVKETVHLIAEGLKYVAKYILRKHCYISVDFPNEVERLLTDFPEVVEGVDKILSVYET